MQFLREKTARDAVVVGASYPQISWYTDRQVLRFLSEERLQETLEQAEWVIVTNFEREQRPSVPGLVKLFTRKDVREGNAVIFKDALYETLLLRSRLLKQRLEEKQKSSGPLERADPQSESHW